MVSTTPKLLIEPRDHPASYVVYYDAGSALYRAKACFDGGTDYNDPTDLGAVVGSAASAMNFRGDIIIKGISTSYPWTSAQTIGDGTSTLIKLRIRGESGMQPNPNQNVQPTRISPSTGITALTVKMPNGISSLFAIEDLDFFYSSKVNNSKPLDFRSGTGGHPLTLRRVGFINADIGTDTSLGSGQVNSRYESVQWYGCNIGHRQDGTSGSNTVEKFDHCLFQSCVTGAQIKEATGASFETTVFENCSTAGIELQNAPSTSFKKCWFEAQPSGAADILVNDYSTWAGTTDVRNLSLDDCWVDGGANDFIRLNQTFGRIFNVTVKNCNFAKSNTQYITRTVNTAQWGNARAAIFGIDFIDCFTSGGLIHGIADRTIAPSYGINIENGNIAPGDIQVTFTDKPTMNFLQGDGSIYAAKKSASAPTTTDIPPGQFRLWKNTTDGSVKLYYNDAGSLKSVTLT